MLYFFLDAYLPEVVTRNYPEGPSTKVMRMHLSQGVRVCRNRVASASTFMCSLVHSTETLNIYNNLLLLQCLFQN